MQLGDDGNRKAVVCPHPILELRCGHATAGGCSRPTSRTRPVTVATIAGAASMLVDVPRRVGGVLLRHLGQAGLAIRSGVVVAAITLTEEVCHHIGTLPLILQVNKAQIVRCRPVRRRKRPFVCHSPRTSWQCNKPAARARNQKK